MNSRVALITFLDGYSGAHPDQGLPEAPAYPDQGLPPGFSPVDPGFGVRPPVDPGYGRPGYSPVDPGYGQGRPPHISTGPIYGGGRPTHPIALPPVGPDNTLPEGTPPPQVSLPIILPTPRPDNSLPEPDQKFELKFSFRFGWVIVAVEEPPTAQPK
jgi:hypothetical protein